MLVKNEIFKIYCILKKKKKKKNDQVEFLMRVSDLPSGDDVAKCNDAVPARRSIPCQIFCLRSLVYA